MMIRNFFSIIFLFWLCTATLLHAQEVNPLTNNTLAFKATSMVTVLAMADPTKPDFSDPVPTKEARAPAKKRKLPKNPIEKLSLQQTLISKTRKVAIINGKTVTIGENISGAKLVKINSDNVVLLFSGKPYTLNLTFPSEIKEVKR